MKVVITVQGPLGMQEVVEHKPTDFRTSVQHAIRDLQFVMKHVDKDRENSWQALELRVER